MTKEKTEDLFDEYKNQVYRFCMQLTKDRSDADDLFQDTFLLAYQKHERIDEAQNPKSYLYTMCLNLWKSGKRKRTMVALDNERDYLGAFESSEETVLRREEKRLITQAVMSLKDRYRIPVCLYYTDDLSVSEISNILKIPEGTVKSRLHKARSILRERLEGHDDKQEC